MTFMLAVLVGGAIGAPLRFLIDRSVTHRTAGMRGGAEVPWGLIVVNLLGSALAGVVLASTAGDLRVLLLTGLCGALTTFSGFAWETHRLWQVRRTAFWFAFVVTPLICVVAFLLTWHLTGLVVG